MNGLVLGAALVVGLGAQAAQTPPVQRDPRAALISDQQAPPTGTGVIAGTVVQADSGRPGRRASVTLSGGEPSRARTAIADDQGHFAFTALPGGTFTLTAIKAGWLDTTYGQKRPGNGRPGTPIQLVAGQRLDRIALAMPRGGVITGTVLDEAGDPAFNVPIRLMKVAYRSGARTLAWSGTGRTDDRGVYRIAALLPGEYIVTAVPAESDAVAVKMRMAEMEARAVQVGGSDAVKVADARATLAAELFRLEAANDLQGGLPPVYYLNTTNGKAAVNVAVDIGEEKPGIDLQLQRAPVARISGSVVTPDGPVAELGVQLIDHQHANPGAALRSAPVRNGQFSFAALPPGQYTLWSMGMPRPAVAAKRPVELVVKDERVVAGRAVDPVEPFWALMDVALGGQPVDGIVLTLQRPMTLSGQAFFDGPSPPADLTRVMIRASRADLDATPMEVPGITPVALDAGGRFTLQGLLPGRYRISATGAPGFTVASATVGGVDTLDIPLEVKPSTDIGGVVVTFSRQTTELSGSLQDAAGAPAPDYTVVVFATDDRFWLPNARRTAAVRPGSDGRFRLTGLPPGDYRLAAVTDVEPGQWCDPVFLRPLMGASVAITLSAGEKREQSLRVK